MLDSLVPKQMRRKSSKAAKARKPEPEKAKAAVPTVKDLRDAIDYDDLLVCYQPKIACRSIRVVGAEALLRWQHPQLGLLSPADFLPLAETSGLMDDISWYVIRRAMEDAATFSRSVHPITISVNVDVRMFEKPNFCMGILSALNKTGLEPKHLELEFTERTSLADPAQALKTLRPLRDIGVRFAIDDFGAGFSSLSSLDRLPVDMLKFDGALTRAAGTRASIRAAALMTSMLRIAGGKGLQSIAEGVETVADFDFVRRRGMKYAQGYLFSPALPQAAFGEFLAVHHAGASGMPVSGLDLDYR